MGVAIPVAISLYELCLLAAAAVAALLGASPQGQRASEEASKLVAEALEEAYQKPVYQKPVKLGPDVFPVPCTVTQRCPKEEPEKCPVCSLRANPIPGFIPRYVREDDLPRDHETNPPLTTYVRTKMTILGARVWRKPDDSYIHRDTMHLGKTAELETYSRREIHTGAICPHCAAQRGGAVPGRDLSRAH